jgi:hypothetical protein
MPSVKRLANRSTKTIAQCVAPNSGAPASEVTSPPWDTGYHDAAPLGQNIRLQDAGL